MFFLSGMRFWRVVFIRFRDREILLLGTANQICCCSVEDSGIGETPQGESSASCCGLLFRPWTKMGAENREVETAANRSRIIPDAHRITSDDVWPIILRNYLSNIQWIFCLILCFPDGVISKPLWGSWCVCVVMVICGSFNKNWLSPWLWGWKRRVIRRATDPHMV